MTIKETIEEVLFWFKGDKTGEETPLVPLYTKEELEELERDKGLDRYK